MSVSDFPVTDPAIISAVLNGQKDRFQELIIRHQNMVYAVAWSQLGNVELAEEAVQQTFVKAYSSLASLKDPGKFRSWLAAITRNASVSIGRTRRRELTNSRRWDIEPVARRDEASADRANLTDELRATVAALPETHRQVLTLFYLEDQSVKRVAETLDLSESAVKTRLNRARKVLRQELERRLGDSLSELAPSHSLVLPIMAALPVSPSLSTAAKVSVLGTSAAGPRALLFFTHIGAVFVAMIPAWLMSSRISKQFAGDFQEGQEHEFRRKNTLQQPLGLIFLLLSASVAAVGLADGFGYHTTCFLIAAFCLWGIWKGLRTLRVNNSGLSYAAIACLVLWFVVCVAEGICLMTGVLDVSALGMTPVALTMIVHFSILYRYRSQTPNRMDYNLFLRAATGGLIEEQSVEQQEQSSDTIRLDADQREAFAKFLGQRWLITDYALSNDSIQMELPAARPSLFGSLFGSARSRSKLSIDDRGNCQPYLSPTDRAAIDELTEGTDQHLEPILTRAMEKSVWEFSGGDPGSAHRTLCAIPDGEIFKPDVRASLSRRQRRLFALTIAIAIFLLLLWPTTEWLASYFGLR
ncbi:MAG: RNA polymerase sigma factor [Pirellulaceae bacterium]